MFILRYVRILSLPLGVITAKAAIPYFFQM